MGNRSAIQLAPLIGGAGRGRGAEISWSNSIVLLKAQAKVSFCENVYVNRGTRYVLEAWSLKSSCAGQLFTFPGGTGHKSSKESI